MNRKSCPSPLLWRLSLGEPEVYAERTGGGAKNAGVENEAPDSIVQIRRPKKKWHMLNEKRQGVYITIQQRSF